MNPPWNLPRGSLLSLGSSDHRGFPTPLTTGRHTANDRSVSFTRANLISESTNRPHGFQIGEGGLSLLCEFDYPGNVRSLRNLVFELTSYVEDREGISVELVQSTLARLRSRLAGFRPLTSDLPKMFDGVAEPEPYIDSVKNVQPVSDDSFLKSIARKVMSSFR